MLRSKFSRSDADVDRFRVARTVPVFLLATYISSFFTHCPVIHTAPAHVSLHRSLYSERNLDVMEVWLG